MQRLDTTVYSSPFSKGFWSSSAKEFKNIKTIILAAIFVALRVVIKSTRIPIYDNISLSLDFFVNSVGSMLYGPLMGLLAGAVSDTIGAILFPNGPYFFPFIIVEMLSSFIFGMFLYRQKLSEVKIILARFFVVIICNLIVNPAIMKWYYSIFYTDKVYDIIVVTRIIKNLVLLPFESIILILWLSALSFVAYKSKISPIEPKKMKITPWSVIFTIVLVIVAVAALLWYFLVYRKS